jgi:uncharacterized membrane protein
MSDDAEITAGVSRVLLVGLILSLALLLAGGTIHLIRHGHEPAPDRSAGSRPVKASDEREGRRLIRVALVVLIAVPILRVAYAGLAFARRRDWLYVALAAVVLAVLAAGNVPH